MTPAARVQAAIDILNRIQSGEAAEKALTSWGRRSRFAGSKDRAAIRDHVFDVLRMWRSTAALGGAESGRGRMIGLLRAQGQDVAELFTGQGHAPAPLSEAETQAGHTPEGAEAMDLPDWLAERFTQDLADAAEATAEALKTRAPVFLRVNLLKADVTRAQAQLAAEGIETRSHPLSPTALEVLSGARGVARSDSFAAGLVELQDAASQAVVDAIVMDAPARILDYCAGGGGKTLALAARAPQAELHAHDADPRRMSDLPQRAARAGVSVRCVDAPEGAYDVVMADVPCSGSGAWRRAPEGKWLLTPQRLSELNRIQSEILNTCAGYVAPGGCLAFATCSVLRCENEDRLAQFLTDHPDWRAATQRRFLPADGGDGFFVACVVKPQG
ncbi:RsmB/NOP family class I SAM-dependent RNA methyltransferase [Sagittula sp. SSi028]|uniref:RsmB/NOP family class I SAM-dependent RNA methyltransferase n=1 Tax=Sagittula sp. SSi028 TaxID=3400636 RepID=UPI003AF686C2